MNNRIASGSGFTYDAAGNIINDSIHSYTYDAENRIVKVDSGTTGVYSYDAEGRRVAKTAAATSYEYLFDLGGRAVTELVAGTATTNRTEAYAGGRHLATQNVALGTTYFIHGDWLGTERARTNLSNTVVETCTSLPYGDNLSCTGSDVSPLHFTGKMRDAETGLDEFPARYYSSTQGRWYSPDWASAQVPVPYADLHNPQTLNLYDYVGSDPSNHADADGHRDYAQSNSGNPCYNTASAECAAAKKAQKQVIYTYQGDHVLVTNVSTTTVANKDGTTTETKILTSAAFSTKKGQEGQFIGAGSETITRVKDDVGAVMSKTSSGWSDIGYGQAAQAIGANNLAQGVAYATPGPEHFFPQVWKDIQHHPLGTLGIVVRSAAIPVGVACPWCGIGMAIGGEALATADSAKDATPYP